MLNVVRTANEELNKMSNEDINLRGMGTTLVLAVILGSDLRIVNVGDSRAYLINQNGVVQVTKDHSIVQEMVDNGEITKEQAIRHPRKNIITRALGVSKEIDADYFNFEIKQGDFVLLCTDGFSNSVTEEDIMELFLKTEFDDIAKRAVNLANETGGSDNITVAAIKR
jgi:protein phosphatase